MRAKERSGPFLKDDRGFIPWYLVLLLMGGAAAVTTFVGTRTVAENRQERSVGGVTLEETFDDPKPSADPCATEQGFSGQALIIPVQLSSCPKPEKKDEGAQVTGQVGDDTPSVQSHNDPDPVPQYDPGVIYVDPGAYEDPHEDPEDDPHGGTSGGSTSSTTNCVNGVCTSSGGGGTSSGGTDGGHSGGTDGGQSEDPHSGGGGGTS